MNDDLLDNPFDEEYKGFARNFTSLLKSVIETIDRHGLSRRHLERHSQRVSEFFDNFLGKKCSSEAVRKYQKRFQKNRNKLFTFINFDGVPWNNNYAEHAIKHFATYRNVKHGLFSANGIKQYLVLLSIFQTCKYKKINFLEFLLSKEKDINKFERSPAQFYGE